MIIPFFIPHAGCPHQCVFCNQKNITGQSAPVYPSSVPNTINDYLKTNTGKGQAHIAFYGGSFTALPINTQREYLEVVQPYIHTGEVQSIRLSTRPDCIIPDVLIRLKAYHVGTVELGVQSMDDRVLELSGRGHAARHTIDAVTLLREYGFTVGLQLMPGLPGDSSDGFTSTVENVVALKPDFVRLYPALVIEGTPLAEFYRTGRYAPLALDDAVSLCRDALVRFEQANIDVIRIGLQPTKELDKPGTILAGPYHPAFRQLVESSLLLEKMRCALRQRKDKTGAVAFQVSAKDLSAAIGQRRSNIDILKKEFGLRELYIVAGGTTLRRREPVLFSSG